MPSERGVRGVDDAEVDELYESSPETFTKKRDELAKRLKSEGKADEAASVKALRKPTQIAWVLNQVARRFPDEVGELVDVGRELARAQRKALRGGDASGLLRTAIGRQRDVVRALTTKTAALMRELEVSPTGHLDEVAGALQAALVDPVVGAALEEGRLEKVPAPAAGFPGASPQIEVAAKAEPEPRKTKKKKKQAATPVDKKRRRPVRRSERRQSGRVKSVKSVKRRHAPSERRRRRSSTRKSPRSRGSARQRSNARARRQRRRGRARISSEDNRRRRDAPPKISAPTPTGSTRRRSASRSRRASGRRKRRRRRPKRGTRRRRRRSPSARPLVSPRRRRKADPSPDWHCLPSGRLLTSRDAVRATAARALNPAAP